VHPGLGNEESQAIDPCGWRRRQADYEFLTSPDRIQSDPAGLVRRYITWRNNHVYDERLRRIIDRANVALTRRWLHSRGS
jgi:hypothetical protein